IQSHRCLQMTPNIYCNQRCIFCWRSWEHLPMQFEPAEWDRPEEIVEESIKAQRKLLCGFGGLDEADKKKLKEAQSPNQAAISLLGEPTLYPYLGELVDEYRKRDFTTFVVSNGMNPAMFEKMADEKQLPTQLYISLDAPDKETHLQVNVPLIKDSWEKLNRTLELLPDLKTRKVIRITALKGYNMHSLEGWAELLEKAQADFIEIKSYMFIGGSRQRLTIENMPRHPEVRAFSEQIEKATGGAYKIIDEQPISRVVLLTSGEKRSLISND
ncbi:MAG: 4-demethylwyosine synthase TYW1, partial [Candidatus Micrarchaeota archaeon]